MIYLNNNFYVGGLSFKLPDFIYIVTNYERTLNNGFAYKNIDENVLVTFETVNAQGEQYFHSKEFKENNFEIESISRIGYGGIKGVAALYRSKKNEYYEIRYELPKPTNDENIFVILIETKKSKISIKEALNSPFISDFLLSFKKGSVEPIIL